VYRYTVSAVQKLQTFVWCAAAELLPITYMLLHAWRLVHHVGGHLSKRLELRSWGTASHA